MCIKFSAQCPAQSKCSINVGCYYPSSTPSYEFLEIRAEPDVPLGAQHFPKRLLADWSSARAPAAERVHNCIHHQPLLSPGSQS